MSTLEELDREYAKKRAEILAQDEVRAKLPEPPKQVCITRLGPWIVYEVKDAQEALAIVDKFPEILDAECWNDGCTYVGPKAYAEGHGKMRWAVPQCIEVLNNGGKGFYVFEIGFYTPVGKIKIEVKSPPWHLRASQSVTYDRHGDPDKVEFRAPTTRGSAQQIKWGAGSRDSFRHSMYFSGVEALKTAVNKEN